jgi:hypothetical protein
MAVRFSATGEHYTASPALGVQANVTMAGWAKLSSNRGGAAFQCLWGVDNGAADSLYAETNNDGVSLRLVWDNANVSSSVTLTVGTWYFVAFVASGATGTLYVRAASATSFTTVAWSGASTNTNVANVKIGEFAGLTTEWLDGCVSAVKMWTATLTQADLEQEMWSYMPVRTANLQGWWPLIIPETVDYSGNGATLSGGSGTTQEDGPGIPWRSAVVGHQYVSDATGIFDPEVLQVLSDTSASDPIVIDFAPASVGSMLLLFVASDTTKVGDPAGWSVPTGGAQDGAMQLYGWYKVAAGGEDTVTVDLTAAASSAWALLEISRAAIVDTSAGQFADSSAASYDTPIVSPSGGRRYGVGVVAGRKTSSQTNSITAWSNDYAELADVVQMASTSISLGVAVRAMDVLTGDTTTTTGTYENAPTSRASMLIVLRPSDVIDDWTTGWAYQVG